MDLKVGLMNSIFAGLGIIGLGIFAILIFRRALKEQEIIDAAYKEKQWHLNQKSSLDNGPFDTWWTPEFEAMRKRYGMESPQDDYVAAAQFAADAAALYKKVGGRHRVCSR